MYRKNGASCDGDTSYSETTLTHHNSRCPQPWEKSYDTASALTVTYCYTGNRDKVKLLLSFHYRYCKKKATTASFFQ